MDNINNDDMTTSGSSSSCSSCSDKHDMTTSGSSSSCSSCSDKHLSSTCSSLHANSMGNVRKATTKTLAGATVCSTQKRKAGRKKFRETRHPIYKGVRERNGGKWVCEIREPHKKSSRLWLGTYPTPEMAARAYDVAALALKGTSAPLNFHDSGRILSKLPNSASHYDIRLAALKAAQAFRPTHDIRLAALKAAQAFRPTHDPLPGGRTAEVQSGRLYVPCVAEASTILWSSSFIDEDEVFNMPSILASMAEGMLLAPPAMEKGFNDWDDDDHRTDNIGYRLKVKKK